MNLIDTIEILCNEVDSDAMQVLAKIREAIKNERKPDFSKIKDGDHFT